jgi:uncharacterized protein
MSTIQRRIVLFFLVAYALTWFGWLGNWLVPGPYWLLPMNPFGPIIAAPLVIWFTEGRDGVSVWWRRILRFKAPVWVYAVAFFVPLGIIVISMILAVSFGAIAGPLPYYAPIELLLGIPIALIAGPAPEEPAFRGYGQHELQETMSPLNAALLIGLGVLIWHTPVFLTGNIPWPLVITLIAVSVVYAWLYQVGGSVWPLVTLHFVQNYFGGEYFGTMFANGSQLIYIGILTALYVVWAGGLAWWNGPSLGRRPLSP